MKAEYRQEAKELIQKLQQRGAGIGVISAAARLPQNTIIAMLEETHVVTKGQLVDLHQGRRRLREQGFLSHSRALWAFILREYLTQRFGEGYTEADAKALVHGLANRYALNEDERAELNATLDLVKS